LCTIELTKARDRSILGGTKTVPASSLIAPQHFSDRPSHYRGFARNAEIAAAPFARKQITNAAGIASEANAARFLA
jgi:hypothetical protein